jgi:hypothetical protein
MENRMFFNMARIVALSGAFVVGTTYDVVAQSKGRWSSAQCNEFAPKENRTSEIERDEFDKRIKLRDTIDKKSWTLMGHYWCSEAMLTAELMRGRIERRNEFEKQCPALKKDQRCDSQCWGKWLASDEKDVASKCQRVRKADEKYRAMHEGRILWHQAREMQKKDRGKAAELYKAAAGKFNMRGYEHYPIIIDEEKNSGVVAPVTRDLEGEVAPSARGTPRTDAEACKAARLLSAIYKREGVATGDFDDQIGLECDPVS